MTRYECSLENGKVPARVSTILVPVDLSPASVAILQWAVDLATVQGARVDALHVIDLPPYPAMAHLPGQGLDGPTLAEQAHLEATKQLRRLVDEARREGVHVRGIVESGDVLEHIVRDAKGYDLVVVGSHRSGLTEIFFGNTADKVAGRVDTPVVGVRIDER